MVRKRRMLSSRLNAEGGDGEKPRKTRHFRNCQESSAATATEFRWKSTLLDRAAKLFEDGRSESAAGTSNEHCAGFGRLQVELGWLEKVGSLPLEVRCDNQLALSGISGGSVTKTSYVEFPSIARVSAHRWNNTQTAMGNLDSSSRFLTAFP